jgi:hypothetical protein
LCQSLKNIDSLWTLFLAATITSAVVHFECRLVTIALHALKNRPLRIFIALKMLAASLTLSGFDAM